MTTEEEFQSFEDAVRPAMKWLCENHSPHVTIIITPTRAELFMAEMSTGQIMDYVKD